MEKLVIRPVRAGYSFAAPADEVLRTQLAGGAGRYRADILNAASLVNVSWTVREDGYQYLWAFFRTVGRGADPFLIDLLLEDADWTERTAHFIPGSFKLEGRGTNTFQVSAQLEVEAIEVDEEYDAALVAVAEGGLCDMAGYLNLFSVIVNENWPHT